MRLHHLSVTAFGPFAGTETVDFDTLNDAGLFLLAGATGAGKTSILDAVCFALYGSVPGVRGIKTLKSQHADDEIRPEVVLDFSVRERRFRIRRSPEWSRPKRRGTGMLTEKAAASLIEVTSAGEEFLTSRAAEVGLMVSELIGMRAAQFQQVAMLPQGEFARFLQASSQDRHDVLQHLFQTDRFARIEDWVNDHSRRLRQRSEGGETAVRQLVHTLAERAGVEVPETLITDGPGGTARLDQVLPWAEEVLATGRGQLAEHRARQQETTTALAAARAHLDARRRHAETVRRRDDTRQVLDSLAATEGEGLLAEQALAADARAAACRPILELLDRARVDAGKASGRRDEAVALLRTRTAWTHVPDVAPVARLELPEDLTGSGLEDAEVRTRTLLTKVEGLLPRVRALTAAAAQQQTAAREREQAEDRRERARETRDALPARIEDARADLALVTQRAARREALALQVSSAAARAEAAAALPAAETRLAELRDLVRDRRDAAADAREAVQDLGARRLAGIAAELAGRLRDGEPCQVCGSTAHPAPADSGPDPVTETEQEAADVAYQVAQEELLRATEAATAAESRVAELSSSADGHEVAAADAALQALRAELADAERAEAGRTASEAQVTTLVAELEQARAAIADLDTVVATMRQDEAAASALVAEIREEIHALLGEGAEPTSIPALVSRLADVVDALAATRAAITDHERAETQAAELEAQAVATATDHGFGSVTEAREASLSPDERSRLEAQVADRAERAAAANAVLNEPEVLAVGDDIAPDLTADEAAAAAAELEARAAARDFDIEEQRVDALAALAARLAEALTTWAPAHEEYVRAESMSKLVRGMGSDNQLQMRLSAYVLATRLDQVLDAANERLSHMRDQRYLLQRTGRAARRGSQAGLGLEVVDQWTGDVRDPATLSGGETFVVSLSLALGLADVVTQEAGGTEIETLFVDEGFGTLDADTLDDVMDRLDGLRAGGRTVGVVSHVSELRTRIPAQLHVRKSPRGSTIHVETLVG